MRITFNRQLQVWKAADDMDIRPVLSGVYVDPEGWLVAANGFILAAVPAKIEAEEEDLLSSGDLIIPAKVFPQWIKGLGRTVSEVTVNVRGDTATAPAKIQGVSSDVQLSTSLIPGSFPKWRTLIPKTKGAPVRHWSFNPDLLKQLYAAIGLVGVPGVLSTAGKTHPLLVAGEDGAFGLIMPIFFKVPDVGWILELRKEKSPEL